MKTSLYRLRDYRITERDTGELSWESHFGLGSVQEGQCYKKGSILFIGPAENERLGYLILEFTDRLKRLPDWLKTDYYCTSLEIYHCDTGRIVSRKEMDLWKYDHYSCREEEGGIAITPPGLSSASRRESSENAGHRLHKYEIIQKEHGRTFWNACSGPFTGEGGICNLLEDILFIGPPVIAHETWHKRQFLAHLDRLPEWRRTKYYCPKSVLHDCMATNRNP